MTCDKCHAPATSSRTCDECGKTYCRCDSCGGDGGAKRSLKSHKGLYHPKNISRADARTVTMIDDWGHGRVVGGYGDVGR